MKILAKRKFKTKINLAITTLVVLSGLVTAVIVSHLAGESLLAEARKRGLSLAINLAGRASDPLLALDFLRLKNMVDQVERSSEDIAYAFLQDYEGQVLVHTFQGGFPVDLIDANVVEAGQTSAVQLLDAGRLRIYDFAVPVTLADSRLGVARVGLSLDRVQDARRDLLLAIFGATAGVALLALVLGSFFARTVTRRLGVLRTAAEEMLKGNLDVQAGPTLPRNCWEIMDCDLRACPAFGDRRRRCWYLAGTMCPDCAPGEFEQKIDSCRTCPVYLENTGDELQSLAEAFDVMAITLKTHIEELKSAEQNLARQEQLLRSIFDVTPDLVSLQDEHRVYRAVNKAFRRYFSLSEEDVVGRTDAEIFSREQAVANEVEDNKILQTGIPLSKEILVSSGETKRWFHVVKVPVYSGRDIVGLLMTARDISVIKRYQEQLIHSQKMEDLGKLAGGVAHEINTPLGIILGYSQMLLEDLSSESRERDDVAIIERQAKVCRKIVSDLLGFSRHIESSIAEVDLNESITEVLALVRHIFRQERVNVESQLDRDIPSIRGDKEKLKQVWINLLNNAFDAIGSDGTIAVRTKLCKHRRRAVVTFADTGSGISEANMNKIFDPFFSTKPAGSGTGLGLSVSFGIIQDHKGKISAVSPAPVDAMGVGKEGEKPPGPGTMFIIELPLTDDGLPEDECDEVWKGDGARATAGEYRLPSQAEASKR